MIKWDGNLERTYDYLTDEIIRRENALSSKYFCDNDILIKNIKILDKSRRALIETNIKLNNLEV